MPIRTESNRTLQTGRFQFEVEERNGLWHVGSAAKPYVGLIKMAKFLVHPFHGVLSATHHYLVDTWLNCPRRNNLTPFTNVSRGEEVARQHSRLRPGPRQPAVIDQIKERVPSLEAYHMRATTTPAPQADELLRIGDGKDCETVSDPRESI